MVASAVLVNSQENRVLQEVTHLVSDIRRINPEGEPYCTFGELFTDPAVEQYYEALVGTMKAAKRRGMIQFQGQLLLKGMHDHVIVRIEDGSNCKFNKPQPENIPNRRHRNGSGSAKNGGLKGVPENTSQNEKYDNGERKGTIGNEEKYTESKENMERGRDGNPTAQDAISKQSDNDDDIENDDNSSVVSTATAPARITSSSSRYGMARSTHSQSTRDFGIRKHTKKSTSNSSSNVTHTRSSGITFHHSQPTSTNNETETHTERVDRETNQLLVDIRRITPEGSPFCSFGPLFDDPEVEQYYEALVGTLKSAKRKGLVDFKGQMLFKGMHDKVQINIVE